MNAVGVPWGCQMGVHRDGIGTQWGCHSDAIGDATRNSLGIYRPLEDFIDSHKDFINCLKDLRDSLGNSERNARMIS